MKRLLFYILTFLYACSPLSHTKILKFPPKGFRLDNKTLKTNGYYYCEKEQTSFCRRISGVTSGTIADTNSKYNEKYISAFFLYTDGYSYATGGLITSGVNRLGATSWLDHCNLVKDFNTFEQSHLIFEKHLSQKHIGENSLHDKGVFTIKGDSIHVQVYASGTQGLNLTEYEGNIINDTTFKLFKETIHYNSIPKIKPMLIKLSDTYHFKHHQLKADSTNYLRNNREKLKK